MKVTSRPVDDDQTKALYQYHEVGTMREPDMYDVFQLYQSRLAPLSGIQRDALRKAAEQGMTPFVIGCALLLAKRQQWRQRQDGRPKQISFAYVWSIIEDWLSKGVLTEAQFRQHWNECLDSRHGRRRDGSVTNPKRPTPYIRSDFQYAEPEQPSKGFFSFLDD